MNTPKEIFLHDREGAARLRAITTAIWFKSVLFIVRAQLMSGNRLTTEQLQGALLYEQTLLDLAIELPEAEEMTPLLKHDLDHPRPEIEPVNPTKTKS